MPLVARKLSSSPAKPSPRNGSGQDAPSQSRLKEFLEHDLTPWSPRPHSTANRTDTTPRGSNAPSANPLQQSASQRQLSESQFKIALEEILEPKVRVNIAGRQVHAALRDHDDYEGKILSLTRDYLTLITRRFNARIDRFLSAPRWRLLKIRLTGRHHEKQAVAQDIPFGLRELAVVRNDGLLIAQLAGNPGTTKLPAFLQHGSRRISKEENAGTPAANRRSSSDIATRLETFAAANNSPTYHLLITTGPRATLVAAIQGIPSREIRRQLRLTHRAIEDDLASEPWLPVAPERVRKIHLRHLQCLQVFCRDRPHQPSPLPWLQFALATLATIPLLVGIGAVHHYRQWHRIDQTLAHTPGFEVIYSNPWSFPITISGLRDPLAPTPESVLQKANMNPSVARLRFIPAPSTHPDFILARASRILQPPQGVTLTLEGNTLNASGSATRAWIESTRLRAPLLLPDITCTLSNLIDTSPAPSAPILLAKIAEQLVNQRVFFEESEIRKPLLTAGHMTEISELIYQLQDEAHLQHLPLEIQIAGRYANPEKPFDISQLSAARNRAAHIRDLVLALRPGIDPIHLHATAEHPFAEEHPEMSRLNRAVEFHVILDGNRISPPPLLAEE